MMAFFDVHDEPAVGSLLSTMDTADVVAMWMIAVLVFHTIVTRLSWVAFVDVRELGSCWWQIRVGSRKPTPSDKRFSCRQYRFHQCQKRKRRRRKEQGESWECPLSKLHHRICNLPPPLPFHRRRRGARCIQKKEPEADLTMTPTQENQSQSEVPSRQQSSTPSGDRAKSPKKKRLVVQTSVIDLARMQQWSRLTDRVTSNRREARLVDSDGLLPLHWACSGGPSLEVIKALLKAHPRAAKRTDSDDSTALHFACHYSASAPVVDTLLEAYPKAVCMKDRHGRTPLYHAVSKSSGVEVIRILVEANPSMAIEPCLPPKTGRLVGSFNDTRLVTHRTPLFMAWSAVASSPQVRRRRRGKAWEKACLLLEAAYQQVHESKSHRSRCRYKTYRMLHAVITLDSYLPSLAIRLAIAHVPDQLRQPDELDGRLPLAIAAESRSPGALEMIQILLDAYPQAARASDANGQTALAIALANGKHWNEGVSSIFYAAPDALTWCDRKTRLYPALVAASASNKKAPDDDVETNMALKDDEQKLTTLQASSGSNDKTSNWRSQALSHIRNKGSQSTSPFSNIELDANLSHISTIFELVRAEPSITKW